MPDNSAKDEAKRNKQRRLAVIVACGALFVIGFVSVLQVSIAGVFRSESPRIALSWMPYDAHARARLSARLVGPGSSVEGREAARALAFDAIRRDPLMPAAMYALGRVAEDTGGRASEQTLALMTQGQKLSRRERPLQMWMIEHYLQRQDVQGVLRHVDIALRTSESDRDPMFAALSSAAASAPQFEEAIARSLRQRSQWGLSFVAYLVDHVSEHPQLTVRMARDFLDPKKPDDLGVVRSLMERLGQGGEFALAWEVYRHFGLDKLATQQAGLVQDGDFDRTDSFVPFGWTLTEGTDLWAARERDPAGSGNVLRLGARGGESGEVARQLLRLESGSYRLAARFGDIDGPADTWPTIAVYCAVGGAGQPLVALRPSAAGPNAAAAQTAFTVPAGCAFQWIAVSDASAGEGEGEGAIPWVDSIAIARNR